MSQESKALVASIPVLSQILDKRKMEFEKAIPKLSGLTAERLFKVAMTEFRKVPKLASCDPISFCAAVMGAAQLGLEFGELHHCALVPYGREVKLMVQYQGFLALLWRSKFIKSVAVRVVFEGDDFEVKYGMTSEIIHVPRFKTTNPICYWAGVVPTNGEFMCDVMSLEEVKAHAKQYSKGLDKTDSPWNTAFDEMAKKTVLRRLMKLLSFSPESEVAKAIKVDEELFEAQQKVSRMETFLEVTATEEDQTPEQLELAKKKLEHFCGEAEKMKVDISVLISMLKKEDYDDAQKVNALADTIASHLDSAANARIKS